MAIAAVPEYLHRSDFTQASPGMRFSYLLPIWTTREDQEQILREQMNRRSSESGQLREDVESQGMEAVIADRCRRKRLPLLWSKNEHAAQRAWKEILPLTRTDQQTLAALIARQDMLAQPLEAARSLLRQPARATAPFTTGLGNEHPLENGFAFLNPYGLPYLPGSGVKGVVLQSARELASGEWGENHGWSTQERYSCRIGNRTIPLTMLDVLFGRDTRPGDIHHVRGALSFWDVYPQPGQNTLALEVMTPHQGTYHQGQDTPHESGTPVPINFLSLPAGSEFIFHTCCNRSFLKQVAPDLEQDDQWRHLLEAAFSHAFQWLGFGAKTAVGYGAMQAREATPGATAASGGQNPVARMIWEHVSLKLDPGSGELSAPREKQIAMLRGAEAGPVRKQLPEELNGRLKKKKELKDCTIQVEKVGNGWKIIAIIAVGATMIEGGTDQSPDK